MSDASPEKPAAGLLVTADLIFSTKITGTARAVGLDMQVVSSPPAAVERLGTQPAACVILDLGLPSLATDQIRAIVAAAAGSHVIAFGSHVDAAQLESARAAGCTDVMPRSRFAGTLPQLLQQYLSSKRSQPAAGHSDDASDS